MITLARSTLFPLATFWGREVSRCLCAERKAEQVLHEQFYAPDVTCESLLLCAHVYVPVYVRMCKRVWAFVRTKAMGFDS